MNLLKNGCRRHGILAALILGLAAIAVLFALELLLLRGFGLNASSTAFILADAALRFGLGIFVLFLLLRLEITKNPGFRAKGLGKSLLLAWPFFLLFAGILVFSLISAGLTGRSVGPGWVLTQIVFMASVGFFEELVFRAGVVNLIRNQLGGSRSALVKTAVMAAVIFSLAHCLNLIGHADLTYTLSQVITNFGMGLFLNTLYLRTGNLIGPMIFHTVNDIVPAIAGQTLVDTQAAAAASSGLSPSILVTFVLYLALSAFYLRRVTGE